MKEYVYNEDKNININKNNKIENLDDPKYQKDLLAMFSYPEKDSTLLKLEEEISDNISLFLKKHSLTGEKFPRELEKLFRNSVIPYNMKSVSSQTRFILEKLVPQSVNVSSSSFIGHMSTALPYFILPLAKIMIALNQNLVKIETSKVFTPLERETIAKLHRLIFNKPSSFYNKYIQDRNFCLGIFCSGGTLSNLCALWVARNNLFKSSSSFKGINHEGLHRALSYYGYKDACIITSKLGHYSLKKASDILGIGRDNLIAIDTDEQNKMDISLLEEKIKELKSQNIAIIAVVAVAGTTEVGSVDRLDQISDLCKKYEIHFHIDAAWGGALCFSDKYKHLVQGIELADSVGIDAHKQLYCPVGAGICLFKDPTSTNNIKFNANYIIRKNSRDLGQYSIEGSRSGISLLIHSTLNVLAKKGYSFLIERGIELTKKFSSMIKENSWFELMNEPELNILTYRLVPLDIKEKLENYLINKDLNHEKIHNINLHLNSLTQKIQKIQRERKKSFVSRTVIKFQKYENEDIVVFRVVLSNPLTTIDILNSILEEQIQIYHDIEKEFKIL